MMASTVGFPLFHVILFMLSGEMNLLEIMFQPAISCSFQAFQVLECCRRQHYICLPYSSTYILALDSRFELENHPCRNPGSLPEWLGSVVVGAVVAAIVCLMFVYLLPYAHRSGMLLNIRRFFWAHVSRTSL